MYRGARADEYLSFPHFENRRRIGALKANGVLKVLVTFIYAFTSFDCRTDREVHFQVSQFIEPLEDIPSFSS